MPPCADCYRGHDHPGPVNGQETKLHGHDFYVTEPKSKDATRKGLIVVLSDAFWMEHDQSAEGVDTKVGVVGFCWGAYGATQLTQGNFANNGKTFIDATYTVYPSEITFPQDIDSEVVIILDAKHGFAVRGNPNDKADMEMADRAEDQTVRWHSDLSIEGVRKTRITTMTY
ncbi:hypothetical protein B0J13DRAFT_524570 [Dactylonectria estremocensis]|uniref:Dienelactone hydrolase domain-containing protein n=1 Tax=Dactylonectria estremocensis TaxID=1079267 RepID=A0A9P9EX23_9HYPO|nr:hypothetical protein B0J13DRAFT_524570 [Dactylonectria estremocensis]